MKITQKQIAEIARESRRCSPNGLGQVVNVFRDGDTIPGCCENDVIARGDGRNGWDYRIACIRHPMTRNQVTELLTDLVVSDGSYQM